MGIMLLLLLGLWITVAVICLMFCMFCFVDMFSLFQDLDNKQSIHLLYSTCIAEEMFGHM